MKYPAYNKEIAELLARDKVLSVKDFREIFGPMPMTSVYARIRGLVEEGRLSVVGKGKYVPCAKPAYHPEISDWMRACNAVMIDELEGVNACLIERNGNLEVEVARDDIARTVDVLRLHFDKVMHRKDVKYLAEPPKGCILVGRMISEAPLFTEAGVEVSTPEKELVDALCRKEDCATLFQRMLEVYPINQDRLRRYAARRGVQTELMACLGAVDQQRVEMFTQVQRYMAQTQIKRAWVFGSYARREETDASDLDLLVEYDKSNKLTLLGIVRYQLDIEKIINRKVDLVENGYLKPFAQASAERDKYLIYER